MQNLLYLLLVLACPLCMVVMAVMMGNMKGGHKHESAPLMRQTAGSDPEGDAWPGSRSPAAGNTADTPTLADRTDAGR